MSVKGAFNLINLVPDGVARMSGGLLTVVTTAGTANTTAPNQVIAANWSDNTRYEIIMLASSTDSTKLRLSTKPVLTSVVIDAAGTPETLAEIGAGAGGDYMVIADSTSSSGWAIAFNSAGISKGSPKTYAITIDFGSNTPVNWII